MNEELKKGDYIYDIFYYGGKRKIGRYKIKKVNPKTIKLYVFEWPIKKSRIGVEWFTSLIDAYKNILKVHENYLKHREKEVHENYLKHREEELELTRKEIKYLKRRITGLKP